MDVSRTVITVTDGHSFEVGDIVTFSGLGDGYYRGMEIVFNREDVDTSMLVKRGSLMPTKRIRKCVIW